MLSKVSATFHGGDIFSPASAYLSQGRSASEFGQEISSYTTLGFEKPRFENGEIHAEALHIDRFGNITTNVMLDMLKKLGVPQGSLLRIKMGNKTMHLRLSTAYGDVSMVKLLQLLAVTIFSSSLRIKETLQRSTR